MEIIILIAIVLYGIAVLWPESGSTGCHGCDTGRDHCPDHRRY
jgi:hypothetical protein